MEPISNTYPVAENVSAVSLDLTSKADEFSGACNSGSFLTGPLKPPVESADMKREKNKMRAPVRLRELNHTLLQHKTTKCRMLPRPLRSGPALYPRYIDFWNGRGLVS